MPSLSSSSLSMLAERVAKESNDLSSSSLYHGKAAHQKSTKVVVEQVEGAIIIGAGPSGLACAASLKTKGVPCVLLEKEHCTAFLWKHKTYDRLSLHIHKDYCQLPHLPFPDSYPAFLAKSQFINYLDLYCDKFQIKPRFGHCVEHAAFCKNSKKWRVFCQIDNGGGSNVQLWREYVGKWLVIASGENSQICWPDITGLKNFRGIVLHSSQYKSGDCFRDKRVLVVGCGNSGMEIAFDLFENQAFPSIVVRNPVHVLPKEVLGVSTFKVATVLMKALPVKMVDAMLLLYTRLVFGDTAQFGLPRPVEGPLYRKGKLGRTPVLDVGTVSKIRDGKISVMPAIKKVTVAGVVFQNTDDTTEEVPFDVIVLATGYKSDIPCWLKDDGEHFSEDGMPNIGRGKHWKSEADSGLYAAGFSRRGLQGSAIDAQLIADDIAEAFDSKNLHR